MKRIICTYSNFNKYYHTEIKTDGLIVGWVHGIWNWVYIDKVPREEHVAVTLKGEGWVGKTFKR